MSGRQENKTITKQKVEIKGKQHSVYQGPKGGKYVKMNGGYLPLRGVSWKEVNWFNARM